jgi:hypothetical protein
MENGEVIGRLAGARSKPIQLRRGEKKVFNYI